MIYFTGTKTKDLYDPFSRNFTIFAQIDFIVFSIALITVVFVVIYTLLNLVKGLLAKINDYADNISGFISGFIGILIGGFIGILIGRLIGGLIGILIGGKISKMSLPRLDKFKKILRYLFIQPKE